MRATQSLWGLGVRPAMMSLSWSLSMVSHSNKALAMACILSWFSSINWRAKAYWRSMMLRTSASTFCMVASLILVVLVTERPKNTSPSFSA